MHKDVNDTNICKIVSLWEVLGKRWALIILYNLSKSEILRFNELRKSISGISSTVLSERLLELEQAGLINKKIYPQIPPKVEYSLTKKAKELGKILEVLDKWVEKWSIDNIGNREEIQQGIVK